MLQVHRFVAAERWHTDRRGANGSGAEAAQTNGELHLIAAATCGGLTSPLPLLPMQDGSICDSRVKFVKNIDNYA
jgi:hypothetical protein